VTLIWKDGGSAVLLRGPSRIPTGPVDFECTTEGADERQYSIEGAINDQWIVRQAVNGVIQEEDACSALNAAKRLAEDWERKALQPHCRPE